MNYFRPILLAVLLAAGLAWLYGGGGRERLASWEAWFLDFLVAEAREDFTAAPVATSEQVVLVEFRPQDREEYTAWPPAPLDYIMLLKRLAPHEPEAVVFLEPLQWSGGASFLPELRQALIKFPFVVMGFDVTQEAASADPESEKFIEAEMPVFQRWEGRIDPLPAFDAVTALPEKGLRATVQTGFSSIPGYEPGKVPMVAFHGSRPVPSAVAQAITLFRRVPFAALRLRLGPGARLTLGNEHVIPLDGAGALTPQETPKVPSINALELLTPELGDPGEESTKFVLGQGKMVLISHSDLGDLHARAVATALVMPSMHKATYAWEWLVAALACVVGFWQLRHGRFGALLTGFGLLVLGVLASLLIFRSVRFWCSPLPVLLPVATSTLLAFLWPQKAPSAAAAPVESEPATLV